MLLVVQRWMLGNVMNLYQSVDNRSIVVRRKWGTLLEELCLSPISML